jgi:hypothetical protein
MKLFLNYLPSERVFVRVSISKYGHVKKYKTFHHTKYSFSSRCFLESLHLFSVVLIVVRIINIIKSSSSSTTPSSLFCVVRDRINCPNWIDRHISCFLITIWTTVHLLFLYFLDSTFSSDSEENQQNAQLML